MKLNSLETLFIRELKDLYSAEKQLTKALPKMVKAASDEELKAAFEEHLDVTEEHVKRLEQILEALGAGTRGPKCAGMEGLIKEGQELIDERDTADEAVLDAALIGAAQRVEHYEMAGYGCARAFAVQLGLQDFAQMLQQTLDEEGEANKHLTEIAETRVNVQAQAQTAQA